VIVFGLGKDLLFKSVLGRCAIIPSQVEIQHIVGKVTPKTPEMTPKTPEMIPKTSEMTPKLPLFQTEEAMDMFFAVNEAAIGKVTPKNPEMTSKNPEMTPKSLEMTPKTPEMTSKTPEMTFKNTEMTLKTPKMTPKILPETKNFHEGNGDIDLVEKT
jgi:hypothetical protein